MGPINDHDRCARGFCSAESWFDTELTKEFGPVKTQNMSWTHVGSEYLQSASYDEIFVHQKGYGAKLKYTEIPAARRKQKEDGCQQLEGSRFGV